MAMKVFYILYMKTTRIIYKTSTNKIRMFKLQRLRTIQPTPYSIGKEQTPKKEVKGTRPHGTEQQSQGQEPWMVYQAIFTLDAASPLPNSHIRSSS